MTDHDDLLSVGASLARLSFFDGDDADKISDQTHDNLVRLAMKVKAGHDALRATTAERDALRSVVRRFYEGWTPLPDEHEWYLESGCGDIGVPGSEPMSPAEADAIRAALADTTSEDET